VNKDFTIFVRIKYDTKKENITLEKTDIKKERICDFLEDWLLTQVGAGEDKRKVVERDVYNVNISCDLTNDNFYVKSDTNNDGLTAGIVMALLSKLNKEKEEQKND